MGRGNLSAKRFQHARLARWHGRGVARLPDLRRRPGVRLGEFEAALHGGAGPAGYLRDGTGVGDRDVWPGPWSVEKNRGFGANARLGHAPGGLLGEGGSVYFVTGMH